MQPGLVGFDARLVDAFLRDDPASDGKHREAENVRCLGAFYAAVAVDDYEAALRQVDREVMLAIYAGGTVPYRMAAHGTVEVGDAIRRNFAVITFERIDVESLVAQGDVVVLILRQRGHWRHNGDEYDERGVLEFHFRAGRVRHYRGFVLPFAA